VIWICSEPFVSKSSGATLRREDDVSDSQVVSLRRLSREVMIKITDELLKEFAKRRSSIHEGIAPDARLVKSGTSIPNIGEDQVEFCAIVVTYFPDQSCLKNLEILCHACDRLIIVDNTPGQHGSDLPHSDSVEVIKLGRNIGLAAALNKGIRLAGLLGFENIFLFDQDSRQTSDYFRKMLVFKTRADAMSPNIAFYVPDFFDRNSGTYATFPIIRRFTLGHRKCSDLSPGDFDDAVMTVTSGTLLKYSVFNKIGPFREDYFIDFIDNEYCLRVYKLGYKVAVNCDVILNHAIGRRSKQKIWGVTLKPNFHSSLRRYYIARNGLRTALEFSCSRPVYLALIFARLCHEVLSIILIEGEKARKIKAIAYGLFHGLAGRMGPCTLPELLDEGR
jgi:rhamnosyltransferase